MIFLSDFIVSQLFKNGTIEELICSLLGRQVK